MEPAATNNAKWNDPEKFKCYSQYPPQILGCGSAFYCFFVDSSNQLEYCVLKRLPDNRWVPGDAAQITVRDDEAEFVSAPPALALLDGMIHIVFPDKNNNLIHIQLKPGTDTESDFFHNRYHVGQKSRSMPALAAFKGKLYCAYTQFDGSNTGTVLIQTWDKDGGWAQEGRDAFQTIATTSPISIFELTGRLHIYFIGETRGTAPAGTALHYVYNGRPNSIWVSRSVRAPSIPVSSGFSGCSATGLCWIAFLDGSAPVPPPEEGIKVFVIQQPGEDLVKFIAPGFAPQSFSIPILNYLPNKLPSVPQLAICGNTMMCVWIDSTSQEITYCTRKVWYDLPALSSWMSTLPDSLYISHLTIPGTHDSLAISSNRLVGTHTLNIEAQLRAGIRYFDIRAGFRIHPSNLVDASPEELINLLVGYHGGYALWKSWGLSEYVPISEIFSVFYKFLAEPAHRNECLIVQIKQDWPAITPGIDGGQSLFEAGMTALISEGINLETGNSYWRDENTLPKLGDLRGKIQLVRRYAGVLTQHVPYAGIDVLNNWPNNSFGSLNHPDISIYIQDQWNWGSDMAVCEKKYALVEKYLLIAGQQQDSTSKSKNKTWYINFASAVGVSPWFSFADQVALGWGKEGKRTMGVNERLRSFFNNVAGKKGYGTVLLDFCECPPDLILSMVRTNYKEHALPL